MSKDDDDIFASDDESGDEFGGFDADIEPDDEESGPEVTQDDSGAAPATQEAPTPASPAKPVQGKPGTIKKPSKKRTRKPLSMMEKVMRVMLRRAGLNELPPVTDIVRSKVGMRVPIKDIALFTGEPKDELLAELAANFPVRNIVNLSAEVQKTRVMTIGSQILAAGRMYQPIQVARVEGNLQCTSGRHRLAFLAIAYGPTAKIPVYIEEMTLCEARDAVVVANQARPTKALERAEHAILQAVGGDADAEQDDMYGKTVVTKAKARKYCVYSVLERGHPVRLAFPVSLTSSRKDGGLTTITNVENYWGNAIEWSKDTTRKDFDEALKNATAFLNTLAKHLQMLPGFDAKDHMASMTLSAIGKYYRAYLEITGNDPSGKVADIAAAIVALGEIGRQKSEKTYEAITTAMRGK